MKFQRFITISFCILTLLFLHQTVISCSCNAANPQPTASELLKDIQFIFQGRVISFGPYKRERLKNSKGKYYDGLTTYEVEFEVLKKWKGVETNKIVIETETLSCHTNFEMNKEYFVLATGDKPFEVHYCTQKFINLQDVEKEYGEGKLIEQPQPSPTESTEDFWSSLWKKITSFFS